MVLGDACYRRVGMCPENAARQVNWYAVTKRDVCKAFTVRLDRMKKWMESVKASLRARGKHPFRVIKSLRLRECSVPWAGQEYDPIDDIVCDE